MANTLKFGAGNWATKEGSTLAYNDENGNFKPLPFDFTRASSATVVNKDGLIETVENGIPRIDFLDNTKGALLLEPSSTNLLTYSEDLTQGITNRLLITSNTNSSPDGTNTADKLIPNNTNSTYHYFAFSSLTIATNNVYSVFLKKAEYEYALISFETSGSSGSSDKALINLNNGTIEQSDTETKVKDYGNGWYRCSIKATSAMTSVVIYPLPSASLGSFTGDNTSGIFAWGLQLEQQSYPTSYIPTQGSAATRVADVCNNGGNQQVINSTEGVLYAEMSALSDDLTNRRITISDNSTSNRIVLGFADASNTILALVGSSGTQFISTIAISDTKVNNKLALKYKQNDFALWINGFEAATDTSGNTPTGLSTLKIQGSTGFSNFYGKTKQLQYFDSVLADTQLEQLTSWLSFRDMAEAQSYIIQ